MGVSRSSAAVLAYLMLRQQKTAVEALIEVRDSILWIFQYSSCLLQVRKNRDVRPNDGFLRQLAELDNKLRKERGLLVK
jgi:protein-tyrosine phosphatase